MASSEFYRELNPTMSKDNIKLPKAEESKLISSRSGSGTGIGSGTGSGSGFNSGNDSGHDSDHGEPISNNSDSYESNKERRPSLGLTILSSLTNTIRPHSHQRNFMSNSPTIGNFNTIDDDDTGPDVDTTILNDEPHTPIDQTDNPNLHNLSQLEEEQDQEDENHEPENQVKQDDVAAAEVESGKDKDGFFSVRLTPLIDHSSSNSGLYFAPVIRKAKPGNSISIGRYTEKNKAAAHAPQGSNAPVVFKSKVVSRTHALFQCNEEGQWFVKDCKSSSGTFLNHIRLSPASQESSLMPLIDGDIIQLGMDYRGGAEEVYRCVKMRCEFNKSWQRKINQFNLEIHQRLKNLSVKNNDATDNIPINNSLPNEELSECAICLLKLEPCQALFISPCSHSWHYKCIRPIIIKSYPQFYCPNCRSMCDLETDIDSE